MSIDSLQVNTIGDNLQQPVCVLLGHSIDCITTAVVLASTGQTVYLYTDTDVLDNTLSAYAFEHQVQALWKLYIQQGCIVVWQIPEQVQTWLVGLEKNLQPNLYKLNLLWLFTPELPESWQDNWLEVFNQQGAQLNHGQTPLILSGIETIGTFAELAKQLTQAWVYYIPFVFLQDGQAFASMLNAELWLLGEKIPNSTYKLTALHPLINGAKNSHISDILTIEFARNSIMSMLATRVSFMNECSRLADKKGVDITEVATIMGLDKRIGKSYLKAGWGFGGKTLPAEMQALEQTLEPLQSSNRLMQAVNTINEDQKELIFRKFWQYFDGLIENKIVSIWGASYKAGSGRTTGSAIHPLLKLLWSYNIKTQVYAEHARVELAIMYAEQPLLTLLDYPEQALEQSQAIFIMSWSKDKRINISVINELVIPVFDAQNILSTSQIEALVGGYMGIGRHKNL
ncbi:UDP-glucose/GDP-mannose dehydrogenase family protein [Psychrobacter sp. I-STPA6b]|uniref:UDP-glucose/GDP-mannose dehydrogenase family protein n=1 Tax=Psychrobacter sp. I-STPA6b TaxID=2585718 RepID=UPI001D0C4DBE|nr:UDP-glucose/GDP-mannose dehydrogenase family protein [Psychrobacter sp. I-STPA6b]